MNATQMTKMIGQTGNIFGSGDMRISVRIIDVKVSYGSVRYQVKPVAGCGTAWIDADSIKLYED
jgi:hypothetical protein